MLSASSFFFGPPLHSVVIATLLVSYGTQLCVDAVLRAKRDTMSRAYDGVKCRVLDRIATNVFASQGVINTRFR